MNNSLNNIINTDYQKVVDNFIQFDYIKFLTTLFSGLTFENFLKIIVIYLIIVWIAIIIWVIKDIINRTNNILLQVFSILTVLVLTPLGIVIYLLIRPSKTLFEKYYEEASVVEEDIEIIEKRENIKKVCCFNCLYEVDSEYKFCPKCRIALKKPCISCKESIKTDWICCPYCGVEQIEEKVVKKENKKVDKESKKIEKEEILKKENLKENLNEEENLKKEIINLEKEEEDLKKEMMKENINIK